MKLLWILWQKIKTVFWTYWHFTLVFHYAKTYPRAFLKPLSQTFMRKRYFAIFSEKCNCLFCNTINIKKQKIYYARRALRDSWRITWTNSFKYTIFFNLYNYLGRLTELYVFNIKFRFNETLVVIEYESLYAYFRDIFLYPTQIISWQKFLLFFQIKPKVVNPHYKPQQIRAVHIAKLLKKVLRTDFMQKYKHFWTQQYFYFYYHSLKTFLLSLLLALTFFIILIISLKVTILQHLAAWIIFGNIFFWLMSGFNFFIKRAKFGKFTARLQRFWKHAFVSFWAIEGFLFSLFFYYYLNSSQEPLYMYDRSNLNNDFILNLQNGFFSTFLLSAVLFGCYILSLYITVHTQFQSLCILLIISIGVFYLFFLESYQIYYVFNGFADLVCVFDEEQQTWAFEIESIKLRTKQYYFVMCVIAKFWHFIFIFFSWIFFLLKSLETQKITYNLLSFNYQNLLILFVLNLLCYCNWIHFLFRRFFDVSYFWFFTNPDQKHLRLIVEETIHIFLSCFNTITSELQLSDIYQLIINICSKL